MTTILVCGSREGISKKEVYSKLNKELLNHEEDTIITGGASGVDTFAIDWCIENNISYEIIRPIDPTKKLDYLFRNCVMVGMSDKIIAFWDGKSKGTKFTWDYANHFGLGGYLYEY